MPVFVAATGWLNWDGVSESGIAEGYIQTQSVEWEGKEEELNVRTDNVRTDTCLAVAVTCSSTPLLRLKMLPSTHSQLLTLTLSPSLPSPPLIGIWGAIKLQLRCPSLLLFVVPLDEVAVQYTLLYGPLKDLRFAVGRVPGMCVFCSVCCSVCCRVCCSECCSVYCSVYCSACSVLCSVCCRV